MNSQQEQVYNVDYFIKKFEAIPENKFMKYSFRNESDYSMRCFLGHCLSDEVIDLLHTWGRDEEGVSAAPRELFDTPFFQESRALALLIHQHFKTSTSQEATGLIYDINNGVHPQYQQRTIKERILTTLYDIKAAQEKSQPEVKERIVYVTVDAKVRELQNEEIILN